MTDRLEAVTAGVRYVRTAEGAARFGVPVGSAIITDANGNVVSINGKAVSSPGSKATIGDPVPVPGRPGSSTLPIKFVPTVPGQKAKIPLQLPKKPVAAPAPKPQPKPVPKPKPIAKPAPKVPVKKPSASSPAAPKAPAGLSKDGFQALQDVDKLNAALDYTTPAERKAVNDLKNGKQPSNDDKQALRGMITKILADEAAKQAARKAKAAANPKTAQQKAAAKQAAAQKKAAAGPTQLKGDKNSATASHNHDGHQTHAQWIAALQGSLKALGGPAPRKEGSDAPKAIRTSFTGLTQEQLIGQIRSLSAKYSADQNAMVKSALKKAQAENAQRQADKKAAAARITRLEKM